MNTLQGPLRSRSASGLRFTVLAVAFAVLAGVCRLAAAPADALGVVAVSSRAGLLFADGERIEVRARVSGSRMAATVDFVVSETDGLWERRGTVPVAPNAAGVGEVPLPLELPGRGLYDLWLTARSGDATAETRTSVAIVFPPAAADPRSPWGAFYIPILSAGPDHPDGPTEVARSIRRLGASWARYNFWAHTYGPVTVTPGNPPVLATDFSKAAREVAALRREGLSILGELAQIPLALSSRPDADEQRGDAGPLWCRVKPRDYALWSQLVERLAAEFREEIGVWEILNEADLPDRYWAGTSAEFAEFVVKTAAALRRGNPEARIAAAGFTPERILHGKDRAPLVDDVLQRGAGTHLDLFTVHYTDQDARIVPGWRDLLKEHDLSLPLWNTEERPAVPLNWLSQGDGPFFKFLHVQFTHAYDALGPMVRDDLTVLPAGVEFSVGSALIGGKRFDGFAPGAGGFRTWRFRDGAGMVAVITPDTDTDDGADIRLFGGRTTLTLALEQADGAHPPSVTDRFGRTTVLSPANGRAEVPLAKRLFVAGCRTVSVAGRNTEAGPETEIVAEAEDGRLGPGWRPFPHRGFSGGRTVDIWTDAAPTGPDGYRVEVPVTVPASGEYEVCFSGNSLSRLHAPPSISPFVWRIDDGPEQAAHGDLEVRADVPGAPEGLGVLGTVHLDAGDHLFKLRLTAPRETPDRYWALWFDAVGLRQVRAAEK